ncbi:Conserved_hypothetical protein [Hexamita inflata]|uniref:Uncharacterized protein n=1 Tax=Hexamita inflata TaxID=28002 RepID=A0AA86R108_9EUKA|nr:Conserved hypothetical protein [Hexamita inflata]CAI9963813.1 Conserved hypothetical protein [Hexamita inflata]
MFNYILTLNLNCFAINTSVEYQKQTREVRFTGSPNLLLTAEELKICQTILNDRLCIAQIYIGTETFRQTNVQFHAEHLFYFDVSCQSYNGCQYVDVNKFSIATFQLNFEDINTQITGVAGKFFIRIFNRMECHHETEAVYGADEFHLKLEPVETCMTRPSADQIQTNIYMGNKEMFELQEKISDNVDAPVANLGEYIPHVSHLEFYCTSLSGSQAKNCYEVLNKLQQKDQLYVEVVLETPVSVRYQHQMATFTQSVKLTIKLVDHVVTQDCFSRMELTIFDDRLLVSAYPGALTKCSAAYFSQFDFDEQLFSVSIAANNDYTGFKFLATSPVQYQFGHFYEKYITCEELQITNCSNILEAAQLLAENTTYEITYKLSKKHRLLYKSTVTPKLIQQEIDTGFLEIHDQFICLNLKSGQATASTVYDVNILINTFSKQIVSPLIDRTCTTLSESEQKLLHGFKVNGMPKTASVVINSDILPDAAVNIYDVGEKCWIAWVAFVVFSVLGVVWLGIIANV